MSNNQALSELGKILEQAETMTSSITEEELLELKNKLCDLKDILD